LKITIESTDQIVRVTRDGCPVDCEITGRVWEGTTDSGIPVFCVITRIAAPVEADQTKFQKELRECKPPGSVNVFPLRMVI
jgi:hypothetical protein